MMFITKLNGTHKMMEIIIKHQMENMLKIINSFKEIHHFISKIINRILITIKILRIINVITRITLKNRKFSLIHFLVNKTTISNNNITIFPFNITMVIQIILVQKNLKDLITLLSPLYHILINTLRIVINLRMILRR